MAANEIKNARITSTQLGQDAGPGGIMSAWVHLDYGGSSGQGFGGFALGGKYTDAFVQGVLNAVGVGSWEKLPGTPVRVRSSFSGVQSIGHYLEDRWFDPEVEFAVLKDQVDH